MKTFRILPVIVASLILLFIAITVNNTQARDLAEEIEECNYSINKMENDRKIMELIKQKIDSGRYYLIRNKKKSLKLVLKDDFLKKTDKPWEVINIIDAAKEETKREYGNLLGDLKLLSYYLSREKEKLGELEKELGKRYQKSHGYIEVKINKEKFLRPGKDLVRWNWQFRFDELNGVGVTIKKVWVRGYRGDGLKLDKVEPMNVRVHKFGSALIDTPYMQFGTERDKMSSGKMKFIYTGVDDNGNEVKAELEIIKYP